MTETALPDPPAPGPAPAPTARGFLREHRVALALCVLAIALPLTTGVLYVVALLLPALVMWLLAMPFVAWRRPQRRKAIAQKAGLYLAAFVATCLVANRIVTAAKAEGDAAAAAVLAYHDAHGAWPEQLADAGFTPSDRATRPHYFLSKPDGAPPEPNLSYPSPNSPLSTQAFDFERRSWRFNAD